MSGLFSTLNVGVRGMSVQQKSIDVTSHNIANTNTPGYSRQRATIETTRPFGMPSLNNAKEPGQLGTGAQIAAISRYRDVFLDYQTRVETSTKGQYDERSMILSEVESIFNEPTDTAISGLIGKFFDSWQQLSKQPQSSNTRTVVAQQSAALADNLNHTYKQLIKLKEDVQLKTKNTIVDINSKLDQIAQLNVQIIGVSVAGNRPNDLMDKRDLLIDELSQSFNLNVTAKEYNGIDLSPVDTTPFTGNYNMINAQVNGSEKTLSYVSEIKQDAVDPTKYAVTYYTFGDMTSDSNKHTIDLIVDPASPTYAADAAMLTSIDETRAIWTDKSGVALDTSGATFSTGGAASTLSLFTPSSGALKGYASVQTDINGYVSQLNKLAKAIAFSVNAVHSGQQNVSNDEMLFFTNSDIDATKYATNADFIVALKAAEANINAGNISVNKTIINDVMQIKTRTHDYQYATAADNVVDGETDGARALAIAQLRDSLFRIQDMGTTITDRNSLFTNPAGNTFTDADNMILSKNTNGMKIDNYFRDTVDKLGIQSQEAQRMVKNQKTLLASFEESRASISGVSLDEEMSNLIQFQHAYQANAKIISTVDQLLDVVINGLKR